MSDNLCTENVDRGHGRWTNLQKCGRPAVEDGLCKLHLRVRDRRRAKNDEHGKMMQRNEELKEEAGRLTERLGVTVQPHYSWQASRYTEHMVVPLDWIRDLARKERA